METKELKIVPPTGYTIDHENSNFGCIKFKPIKVNYESVAKELFQGKKAYYTDIYGKIEECTPAEMYRGLPNHCASVRQIHKLLAINMLLNVAKYLNGDWVPNWTDGKYKYYINLAYNNLTICSCIDYNTSFVYFKTKELAEQALTILGEDTIRLAMSTDW